MDSDRAKHLAELITAREKFVADEKERRRDAKGVLETYDKDIKRLVIAINDGQGDLFEESTDVR